LIGLGQSESHGQVARSTTGSFSLRQASSGLALVAQICTIGGLPLPVTTKACAFKPVEVRPLGG
jgi:hypothetical protein